MVLMNDVKRKLVNGVSTGVGVALAGSVSNEIENQLGVGDTGSAAGLLAIGAGVALGSEELGSMVGSQVGGREGTLEQAVEHFGYGIHAAGFDNIAQSFNAQSGQMADRVVTVNADADGGQPNSGGTQRTDEFSLDTA